MKRLVTVTCVVRICKEKRGREKGRSVWKGKRDMGGYNVGQFRLKEGTTRFDRAQTSEQRTHWDTSSGFTITHDLPAGPGGLPRVYGELPY